LGCGIRALAAALAVITEFFEGLDIPYLRETDAGPYMLKM
jgi:hypothetical protein